MLTRYDAIAAIVCSIHFRASIRFAFFMVTFVELTRPFSLLLDELRAPSTRWQELDLDEGTMVCYQSITALSTGNLPSSHSRLRAKSDRETGFLPC